MVGQLRQNDRALTYWILRKKKRNGNDSNSHHMCFQKCRPQFSVNLDKGLHSAWGIVMGKVTKPFANRLLLLSTVVNSFPNFCWWWFLLTRVNCSLHFWFSGSVCKRIHRTKDCTEPGSPYTSTMFEKTEIYINYSRVWTWKYTACNNIFDLILMSKLKV